jgi:hypothetical protein
MPALRILPCAGPPRKPPELQLAGLVAENYQAAEMGYMQIMRSLLTQTRDALAAAKGALTKRPGIWVHSVDDVLSDALVRGR